MSKLIYVDKNGNKAAEGSAEAAFQFHEGDVRLDKFRAAMKAKGKAAPEAPAEESDSSTERVGKGK